NGSVAGGKRRGERDGFPVRRGPARGAARPCPGGSRSATTDPAVRPIEAQTAARRLSDLGREVGGGGQRRADVIDDQPARLRLFAGPLPLRVRLKGPPALF